MILSPRTTKRASLASGRLIKDVESRRFFQAWLPVATRQGLYKIVKGRLAAAALFLEGSGDVSGAEHLRQASPHWMRHTFAKAALLTGQDIGQWRHGWDIAT